ncbi:MAG TPA: DUF4388 domain-containing protein [Acidimicrobiales bacterium]|nr:DUF4388 domain-containing protein [Acidimicrobiales bacterium]
MTLHGTSESLQFAELLELLGSLKKTGLLRVHSHLGDTCLYLREGQLCEIQPNGQNREPGLVEACCDLLRLAHFSFDFEPGSGPSQPVGRQVEVAVVLSAARARVRAWQAVESVIPSLDARLEAVSDIGERTLVLDQVQWALVLGMDGRRSVEALIRLVNGDPLEVCQQLRGLVDQGLARVLPGPVASIAKIASGDEQGPGDDQVERLRVGRPAGAEASSSGP